MTLCSVYRKLEQFSRHDEIVAVVGAGDENAGRVGQGQLQRPEIGGALEVEARLRVVQGNLRRAIATEYTCNIISYVDYYRI